MEDCRWGDCRCPISHILSTIFCPDQVGALADGFREVRESPSFAANPIGGIASKGRPRRWSGQARFLSSLRDVGRERALRCGGRKR
jgi:hypothetical protein